MPVALAVVHGEWIRIHPYTNDNGSVALFSKLYVRKQGATWQWERGGGNHTIYTLNGTTIPIPRHREIGERLATNIFAECGETFGKGWWKQ